jgi:hypothetical protein
MENGIESLDRAVSASGNWYLSLSPVRRDCKGRREIAGLYCEDPSEVNAISSMFSGLLRESTPVFKVEKTERGNTAARRLGSLMQVLTNSYVAEEFVVDKPADISNLLVENNDTIPIDPNDVLDVYEFNAPKRKIDAFEECTRYELLFEKRKELGMSVDYFKDKHGKQQFRYRMKKKEGTAGGWKSASYAREAVKALNEYDKLIDDGNWVCLRKAAKIAEKYFTENEKNKALSMIERQLDYQTRRLIGHARTGLLDDGIAKQVYSRLIMSRDPLLVGQAVHIAKKYLPPEIVKHTEEHYKKILRETCEKNGISCLDDAQLSTSTPDVTKEKQLIEVTKQSTITPREYSNSAAFYAKAA